LIADLDADDEVRREAAIARLAVIGTRAVDRLLATATAPGIGERAIVSALRALESIGDIRALAPARALLDSPHDEVAAAAAGVLTAFLHSKHGTEVLDSLVAVSLDTGRPDATRLAALDALAQTGSRVATPVWDRLRDDPSLAVRQRAARESGVVDPLAEIEAAAAGAVPGDPDVLRRLIDATSATAPLVALHRLIEVVKAREARERSQAARDGWRSARGAIHLALAQRDSRVALYDLRDAIAGTLSPLPPGFLAAIAAIGDAEALEAIAAAYARAVIAGASDWLEQLSDAFRAVARRERIGPRSAVTKRIEAKWPAARGLIERKGRTGRK